MKKEFIASFQLSKKIIFNVNYYTLGNNSSSYFSTSADEFNQPKTGYCRCGQAQDSGFIAPMVQVWVKRGVWMMLWSGLIGKLMVDNCPKIWYNARREGKYPLAPFCFLKIPAYYFGKNFQVRITPLKNFGACTRAC